MTLKDAGVEGGLGHQAPEEEARLLLAAKRPGWSFLPASARLPSVQAGLSHDLRPRPGNAPEVASMSEIRHIQSLHASGHR